MKGYLKLSSKFPVFLMMLSLAIDYSFQAQIAIQRRGIHAVSTSEHPRKSENGQKKTNQGSFWHITDIHFDRRYRRNGILLNMCHKDKVLEGVDDAGKYGNFNCDSPLSLLNLTFEAMKEFEPNPDFIIWTGDTPPHVKPFVNSTVIFGNVGNVTTFFKSSFPHINIFPSIGDYDVFPPNNLDPDNNDIYDRFLIRSGWRNILPSETHCTFRIGGFYSYNVHPGLWIISLNTVLWYKSNIITNNLTDPSGQFKWFESEMERIAALEEKVYIIGHVAPGFYNTFAANLRREPTYHSHYMKQYFDIIKKYAGIISGQMFGHLHHNTFQLHYCDTENALNSALLSASVTPWHNNFHAYNKISFPVNPSFRLMLYDRHSTVLTNYKQYYLNLVEANENLTKARYQMLYDFSKTYQLPDVSTKSLVLLYNKLKSSDKHFQLFVKYLTAGKERPPCDTFCKSTQLCTISGTTEAEYALCLQKALEAIEKKETADITYFIINMCALILFGIIRFFILYKIKITFGDGNYEQFS